MICKAGITLEQGIGYSRKCRLLLGQRSAEGENDGLSLLRQLLLFQRESECQAVVFIPIKHKGLWSENVRMEPFYFGKNSRLFGAFHLAEGTPRGHGLLIAGPLLAEGIRAQFALRQIANRCAALGYDVLRFDYAGLGNSCGRTCDASFSSWSDNLSEAYDELQSAAGSKTQSVVAVRFAANLAVELSQEKRIEDLIFWDPLFDGQCWLDCLREGQRNLPEAWLEFVEDTDREFMGHFTSAGFVDELISRHAAIPRAARLSAILTAGYAHEEAVRSVTNDLQRIDTDCLWQGVASEILYPIEVINAICDRLT